MTDQHSPAPPETLAQRKQRLQQQCQAYRAGIGQSRNVVRNNLGVESIAKTALGLFSQRAQSALHQATDLFDLTHLSGAKLKSVLPVLVSAYSLLSRRAVLKPVLRGALVVGVAGAAVYLYARRKSPQKTQHPAPTSAPEHVALHEHL
jgi:hypothetical protein